MQVVGQLLAFLEGGQLFLLFVIERVFDGDGRVSCKTLQEAQFVFRWVVGKIGQ